MSNQTVIETTLSDLLKQNFAIYVSEENRVKFSRFPNGFLIADDTDAARFFKESISEKSKRDTISLLLAQTDFITKFGTKSCILPVPFDTFYENEKIKAIKLVNESIFLWTNAHVYKIPASEKALQRTNAVKEKITIIKNLDADISSSFLVPHFLTENSNISYTPICRQLTLSSADINNLDNFLKNYFLFSFNGKPCNRIVHGLQHGDLHYKNIFLTKTSELCITDLDMISENGYPFVDLMHFAIHFVRTKEKLPQYTPLESLLTDKAYFINKLHEYNFPELTEIWIKYYTDDYIPIYIENQIEWYGKNEIIGNELESIKKIQRELNAD